MVMHNWEDYVKEEIKFLDTLDLKTIIRTSMSSEIYDVMNYIESNYNNKYLELYNLEKDKSIFDDMDSYEFEAYLQNRYKDDFEVEYVEKRYLIFTK